MVIADLDIRVINTTTSELIRHLTLDYHPPPGRPPGPIPKTNKDRTR